MRMVVAAAIVMLSAGTAVADCASMWVTRNMVFDRAGYCFGSVLGQALFDNSDCIGTDVALTDAERAFVAHTREMEAGFECQIDTSRRSIDLENQSQWMRLQDMPWRDDTESGCIGWQGAPVTLHAASDLDSAIIGQIEKGDTIIFSHFGPGKSLDFVEISRNERRVGIGWARIPNLAESCDLFAG